MIDPERLAEISERAKKASPAPWRAMADGNQYIKTNYIPAAVVVAAARVDGLVRPWNPHALLAFGFKPEEYETARFLSDDADFIAAARNDVPDMASEIVRLRLVLRRIVNESDGEVRHIAREAIGL